MSAERRAIQLSMLGAMLVFIAACTDSKSTGSDGSTHAPAQQSEVAAPRELTVAAAADLKFAIRDVIAAFFCPPISNIPAS